MNRTISNEEFDRRFGNGEDVVEYLDMSTIRRAGPENRESRRINVDFPAWMVGALDREAEHIGITR
jgi:hypothetical protein